MQTLKMNQAHHHHSLSISKTLMAAISGHTIRQIQTKLQPLLRRTESLTTLCSFLRKKVDACPFKKRLKRKIFPTDRKSLVERTPSNKAAAALGRPGLVPFGRLLRQGSINNRSSKLLLPADPDEPPNKIQTRVILIRNRMDEDLWRLRVDLLDILEAYDSVEQLRKLAIFALKKAVSPGEIFELVVRAWRKVIYQAEEIFAESDAMLPICYAAYKLLADIHLLFRRTEEAIQMYKYAVIRLNPKSHRCSSSRCITSLNLCCHCTARWPIATMSWGSTRWRCITTRSSSISPAR